MKYKNYKSAIHNFTHSFISIDYTKSGQLAINVLIDLYKLGIENKAIFSFIDKTINKKVQYTNKTNYLDLICEPVKASIEDIENFEQFKKTLDSKVEIDSSIKEKNA